MEWISETSGQHAQHLSVPLSLNAAVCIFFYNDKNDKVETAFLKATVSYSSCRVFFFFFFFVMAPFRGINMWRTRSFTFLFFLENFISNLVSVITHDYCKSKQQCWIKSSLKMSSPAPGSCLFLFTWMHTQCWGRLLPNGGLLWR